MAAGRVAFLHATNGCGRDRQPAAGKGGGRCRRAGMRRRHAALARACL